MAKDLKTISDFNDIIFQLRNKEYGAYMLRKMYNRNVTISLMIGVFIMSTVVITPFFEARAIENRKKHPERQVEIRMENLDQPNEIVAPPPPPPPPPADVIKQARYIPPVVVDSVKREDEVQLMTADDAQTSVKNEDAVEVVQEVREEVQQDQDKSEPFLSVEEMPLPPGGMPGLYKYIAENTHYPETAVENNIQGKVFVKFCVTPKGTVDKISIFKGVDPELDAEAIRVVKTFPQFEPGKQFGRPVPVWLIVYINFQLK
jgi:periplasmic protein TonB